MKTTATNQRKVKLLIAYLSFIFLFSCDFTTGVSRRILQAQEYVDEYKYFKALDEYDLLLQMNIPEKIEHKVYYQMAEIYNLHLQNKKNALFYYEKANDNYTDPKLKKVVMNKIVELSFELKNYDKAINIYQKFIKDKETSEDQKKTYAFKIAKAYFEKNDYKKAFENFRTISKDKDSTYRGEAFFYMGQIISYKKQYKEAIDYFKKSLNYETRLEKKIETKFYIANSYERIYDLEKAYDYYYSIVDFYPNPEIIKERLKSVYERKVSRRR